MLDIHFLWSRAQLRQALFCILYWDLLGLVTDTEKMVLSLSSGVTRIRRWWRPTRLPPTLGINPAIVFALPARPSCHPSHVFIYCEQFYNSQPLCCHLLMRVFEMVTWGLLQECLFLFKTWLKKEKFSIFPDLRLNNISHCCSIWSNLFALMCFYLFFTELARWRHTGGNSSIVQRWLRHHSDPERWPGVSDSCEWWCQR